MKPPIVFERHGDKAFVPFIFIGNCLRKFWKTFFAPDSFYAPAGWIIIVVMLIVSMFTTGWIHIKLGADEKEVTSAYQEILKRNPDEDGLKHYANTGMDLNDVKNDLKSSEEKKQLDSRYK